MSKLKILTKGLIKENPNLVLVLGTCPTLAISTSVKNGIGMGLAVTAVLIFSNLFISLLRNIIPDSVDMQGTLRTFDEGMREDARKRITTTAEQIAAASGAKAAVRFGPVAYAVTTNSPELTEASLPALKLAAAGKVVVIPKVSASEDFSEFQKVIPGFFFMLGAPPKGVDYAKAPSNHSPLFDIDEDQLPVGARTLAALAVDFLQRK